MAEDGDQLTLFDVGAERFEEVLGGEFCVEEAEEADGEDVFGWVSVDGDGGES